MPNDLNTLYQELQKIEEKIENYVESLQAKWNYTIQNGKIKFDRVIKEAHRQYKVNLLTYIATAKISHIVTAPIIYGMVVPIVFFDLCLMVYQQICFRAYGIPLVKRGDYLVIDRHLLAYLNALEKLNCFYCSYGNGAVAFAREVLARTEQYWCPIKHAKKRIGAHSRYSQFSDYGDAKNYRQHLKDLRDALAEQKNVN